MAGEAFIEDGGGRQYEGKVTVFVLTTCFVASIFYVAMILVLRRVVKTNWVKLVYFSMDQHRAGLAR